MSTFDIHTAQQHLHPAAPLRPAVLSGLAALVLLAVLAVLGGRAPDVAPSPERFAAPTVIEDWRGNSASVSRAGE